MWDDRALIALWVVWAVSWAIAAFWSSRTQKHAPAREEVLYRALTAVAAVLIFWHFGRPAPGSLWTAPPALGWLLVAVAAAGLGFTWWARAHLGLMWSGSVARKADHRIVQTGPYRIVRHPIYTGLLLALYATALDHGTSLALVGAILATVGFYIKARLEERFLMGELGPEAYAGYRASVPMLVPFWPVRARD